MWLTDGWMTGRRDKCCPIKWKHKTPAAEWCQRHLFHLESTVLIRWACVMAAGYATEVLNPSACIAAGLGHYLGGDKFCCWRAARCFAAPIIGANVVYVTGIDKSLICQRSRGDKHVAAIEWQRKGVINWRLTWAACSFVRRGADGKTKEGRLVGCHKAFPCVQFAEPCRLSSKERRTAAAAWILNPVST